MQYMFMVRQGTAAAAAGLEATPELAKKMGQLIQEFLTREPSEPEPLYEDEHDDSAIDSGAKAKAVAALGRLVVYQVLP